MKIVLQRVTSANVKVNGEVVGSIGTGFLLLFGVGGEGFGIGTDEQRGFHRVKNREGAFVFLIGA